MKHSWAIAASAMLACIPTAVLPAGVADSLPALSDLRSDRTTAEARAEERRQLVDEKIALGVAEPLYDQTEEKWKGALWATLLLRNRHSFSIGGVRGTLGNFGKVGEPLRRQVLETAYGVFPEQFASEIAVLLPKIDNPKQFAMATLYLVRSETDGTPPATFVRIMEQQFPDWSGSPILQSLRHDLENPADKEVAGRPPLADLFAAPGFRDRPVIFSLQRTDRRFPGLAVVRRADGRFVRNADGSLFHIPHLALSASNLPGYITNGNTPEGILSISGTGIAQNPFIGPTPYIHTTLPFEVPRAQWTHDQTADGNDLPLDSYREMLPQSWRGYRPFEEAWYAGNAGRSEIIAHGTVIDPDYYVGEACYPITPSMGCLTATELWSPADGSAVRSDQLALLHAFFGGGVDQGWLAVVDIDAKSAPVTLLDVASEIALHESGIE